MTISLFALREATRPIHAREEAQHKANIRSFFSALGKGSCHYCNRAPSVAGTIGEDGLCEWCRNQGRKPRW